MSNKKLTQLNHEDIKPLREKLHKQQNEICPLLKKKIPFDQVVVDHQHMKTSEVLGVNGAGCVRGAIQFQANVMEGKITNAYVRTGLHKSGVPLPEFLRNLADYLEQEPLPFIHPNEKPKPKKFGKRVFNKLNKAYKLKYPKRKPLVYPKRHVLTNTWIALFKEFNLYDEI